MKEKLIAALRAKCPQITDAYAKRYVHKYVAAVMPEIARRHMLMTSDDMSDGEMDFAADKVSQACGRHQIDGRTGYIYQLMQEHPSTSLVIGVYTGNSITHRVSRVILNPRYKKEIMEELGSLTIECGPEYLQELRANANVRVEIDLESLESYIEQTRLALKSPPCQAYEDKLVRHLQIANQLVALAEEEDGFAYLGEYWEQIDSGRIHGHGLSLQRIPKEVRHAALGPCYRYDFKAASYALMTSLAMQMDPTLKTGALQEYVRYRSAIRKRIAEDVGVTEEWMKGIFTALGFGAALKDNPYNTIRAKLGQEKYHKLLCNAEFMLIKQQLDQVSAVILNDVGKGDFEFLGRTYTEVNPKDGTKRTKNQKLAWLYQCMESDALDAIVNLIPEGYKIKLLVHDCVYLDRRITSQHIADIKWALQNRYALLNFVGEEIVPIHASAFVSKREQEIANFEQEHWAAIAADTELADAFYGDRDHPFLRGSSRT